MRLYLIRHAESENNALTRESLHERKVDPDLTALGYQQRDMLARHIASALDGVGERFAITHLYTSAMYRSLLTTAPLSEALGKAAQVWTDLHEFGGMYREQNGSIRGYGGMTRAEIEGAFPGYQLPADVSEKGWYDAALGLEPAARTRERAHRVAQALRARAASRDVIALVSHAGFLNLLLAATFDRLPPETTGDALLSRKHRHHAPELRRRPDSAALFESRRSSAGGVAIILAASA